MTILDTFYLLFRNDTAATKKDVADLEKQIDALTQKGKKRTDAEDKALKEARKQHKELTSELKEQTKQTDQLGDSFAKTIESGVAALTGFATLGGIKSGILDAQELNRQLFLLSKTTELSARDVKAFASAYSQSGGSKEGFLGFITAIVDEASRAHVPLANLEKLFDNIADDIDKRGGDKTGKRFVLKQQYGLPEESLLFFEQSKKVRHEAIEQGRTLAAVTADDTEKANAFGVAWGHVADALGTDFTHLGSDLFPHLTRGMEDSAKSLTDLTKTKGGVEELFLAVAIGAPVATALLTRLAIAATGWAIALSRAAIPLALFLEVGKATGDVFAGNSGDRQSLIGQGATAVSDKILDWWYGPVKKASGAGAGQVASEKQRQLGELFGASPEGSVAADLTQFSANNANIAAMQAEIARMKDVLAGRSSGGADGGDRTVNVKIDDVHVSTQATDAPGVAQGIGSSLQNELRNVLGNWDDGVQY